MKLKTIALHLAYDLGSAAIGLAADKLRSGIVQRQNAPKAKGDALQEIRDPFEVGPIKVNARVALEGAKFDKELLELGAEHLKDYAGPTPPIHGTEAYPFVTIDEALYIRNEYVPGKLDIERKLFIELTEDDVSAINYAVTAIYGTRNQRGPTAIIKRDDFTKIYSILLKLQHKAAAHVTE